MKFVTKGVQKLEHGQTNTQKDRHTATHTDRQTDRHTRMKTLSSRFAVGKIPDYQNWSRDIRHFYKMDIDSLGNVCSVEFC